MRNIISKKEIAQKNIMKKEKIKKIKAIDTKHKKGLNPSFQEKLYKCMCACGYACL